MNRWRRNLLTVYLGGTLPWRLWHAWRCRRRGEAPVSVLFYHRVADEFPNDWTMSQAMFGRQIDWLSRRFDMVSLDQAQERIRSGKNDRPAVSITFDDGYADNGSFALPLLIRRKIPCTYFVTVKNMVYGEPFPHDVAAGQPLRPHTVDEVKTLAAAGIEIGLHTRSHVDLGQVTDTGQLYDEVVQAGTELANLVDRPIRYFAFPYGLHANLSRQAAILAREAGYLGVCSAYGAYNLPGDNPFHLRRIHADPEWIRFKNWLTVDPRKLYSCSQDPLADCEDNRTLNPLAVSPQVAGSCGSDSEDRP